MVMGEITNGGSTKCAPDAILLSAVPEKIDVTLKEVESVKDHFTGLLYLAMRSNRLEVFKTLLDAGADINETTPEGGTLLHCAIEYTITFQDIMPMLAGKFLPELLKRDIDPFVVDKEGRNALQLLMEQKGNITSLASLLIEYMKKRINA